MKTKFNVNLKDITKDLSLSKSKAVTKDGNGYFRGKLDKIELVEVEYNEQVDINSERTVDEGIKIQLRFNFLLFTENEEIKIPKVILVGTNLNKEPQVVKYKSRGNKKMKNVFNQFTEICIRLGFITPNELQEYDENLNTKIEKLLQEYNEREEKEKVLIAARFVEGQEARIIDIFQLTKVDKIDYKEDIAKRIQVINEDVNRGLKK